MIKTIRVHELIEALESVDQNLPIYTFNGQDELRGIYEVDVTINNRINLNTDVYDEDYIADVGSKTISGLKHREVL
jgi:hypothetical protein